MPPRARRSSCLPSSMTRPRSITTILSAPRIVDRRWAMTKVVRPCERRSSACCTTFSDCASNALVASSNSRIGVLRSRARAITTRWRCPPDRAEPRGPTRVSSPCSSLGKKSDTCAASSACCSSSSDTFSRPNTIFSRRVSSNKSASCVTTENKPRSAGMSISVRGTPAMLTLPSCGSIRRVSRLNIVDFPAPDAPTSAVVSPAAACSVRLSSTLASP